MNLDALVGEHHLGVALDLVRMKRRLALFDDAESEVHAAVRTSDDRESAGELFGDDLSAESLGEAAGRDDEGGVGGGVLDHACLKARRRDVFRAEVEVHRAVVEEKVGIVLDDPGCVEAEPSRDVGPGVARTEELNEEALVRFLLDETGVAPLRIEATDARLVVGELQRGAALGHLLAEGLEAVLEQREAERFVVGAVDDAGHDREGLRPGALRETRASGAGDAESEEQEQGGFRVQGDHQEAR